MQEKKGKTQVDDEKSFVLKETIATLGVMASDPYHREALLEMSIFTILLKIGKENL